MIQKSKQHLMYGQTTYFQHLLHAGGNGFVLIWLGVTSIIHAVVPAWFAATSANGVATLYYKFVKDNIQPAIQEHLRKLQSK